MKLPLPTANVPAPHSPRRALSLRGGDAVRLSQEINYEIKNDNRKIGGALVLGRFDEREFTLEVREGVARFTGEAFAIAFREEDPEGTVEGQTSAEVDLTYYRIMNWLRVAVLDPSSVNYVSCLASDAARERRP